MISTKAGTRHPVESDVPMESRFAPSHSHLENVKRFPQLPQD